MRVLQNEELKMLKFHVAVAIVVYTTAVGVFGIFSYGEAYVFDTPFTDWIVYTLQPATDRTHKH